MIDFQSEQLNYDKSGALQQSSTLTKPLHHRSTCLSFKKLQKKKKKEFDYKPLFIPVSFNLLIFGSFFFSLLLFLALPPPRFSSLLKLRVAVGGLSCPPAVLTVCWLGLLVPSSGTYVDFNWRRVTISSWVSANVERTSEMYLAPSSAIKLLPRLSERSDRLIRRPWNYVNKNEWTDEKEKT